MEGPVKQNRLSRKTQAVFSWDDRTGNATSSLEVFLTHHRAVDALFSTSDLLAARSSTMLITARAIVHRASDPPEQDGVSLENRSLLAAENMGSQVVASQQR